MRIDWSKAQRMKVEKRAGRGTSLPWPKCLLYVISTLIGSVAIVSAYEYLMEVPLIMKLEPFRGHVIVSKHPLVDQDFFPSELEGLVLAVLLIITVNFLVIYFFSKRANWCNLFGRDLASGSPRCRGLRIPKRFL